MVKILVIGDPHFTTTNGKETDCLTEEISSLIVNNDVKNVVILGDTLDRHETVNTNVLFRVSVLFDTILKYGCNLHVLIGNHDIPNNKLYMSEKHPFLRWESDKMHIVNNTRQCIIDDMAFLFVPYVPPGRFLEAIEGFNGYRCIFAHQEFKGCKMGSIISEHGDPIPDVDIISGHIHERQRIGKLYYPGTPYQTNMGESSDKSVSLLDFTSTTILETRFALPSIPKKITIDVTASQLLSWTPPDNHNRYRLTVHGTNAEFITLSKSGTISKLTHLGVKITYKEIKAQSLVLEARRERLNFKDIFMERVLSAHEIKDDLMKIIREIY